MSQVAVVFGGPSPEHDISILTGLQCARTLSDAGRSVCPLYWSKSGTWYRVPATTEADAFLEPTPPGAVEVDLRVPGGFTERRRMRAAPLELDVVLNCCHGGPGEDGTLAGVLRLAGLRVSGPSPHVSALVMDKLATAAVARAAGVPVIETAALTAATTEDDLPSRPWVVKPRFGGSSIGVEAGVVDLDTARALERTGTGRAGVVVQPYLEGWTDLNVAVRTHPELQVSAIERPLRGDDGIYDYQDKYLTGGAGMDSAPRELPARVPDAVATRIRSLALTLAGVAGLTGSPRIDFLWDGADEVVLCEINAIPGAWAAYLWQASGVPRLRFYEDLAAEAGAGPVLPPQWAASSDGRALRAAGSIAAKLA